MNSPRRRPSGEAGREFRLPNHSAPSTICSQSWEALRGDSLGWILDPGRPNLHWRALVELVGRPVESPAAQRARCGANAVEPVASLMAGFTPDFAWATTRLWSPYAGPGWRLVAAVQWGADPEDPRMHTASQRLLETAPGEGGVARSVSDEPDVRLTARALEAMVALGWRKHPRVQEWLAWFEATAAWESDPIAAVAVLSASRCGGRRAIERRAVEVLGRRLNQSGGGDLASLGHPNLLRTDLAEIFANLAAAGVEFRREWRPSLLRLQSRQGASGRWSRRSPVPRSLGVPGPEQPSRWVTLKATRAMIAYAVDAGLPRLFPFPPNRSP